MAMAGNRLQDKVALWFGPTRFLLDISLLVALIGCFLPKAPMANPGLFLKGEEPMTVSGQKSSLSGFIAESCSFLFSKTL